MPANSAVNNSDEIDFYKVFIKLILFLKAHSRIFFITIAISMAVGIGLSFYGKSVYYSAYLIAETSLSDEDVIEVVKSIKYSVEQGDYQEIIKKLNISDQEGHRLKNIDIENVLIPSGWDIDGKSTALVKSKLFKITLDFSRSSAHDKVTGQRLFLDTIRNGIVKYINDNPYINERQKYAKIAIKNMIGEISIQLNKLDTLQKSVIEQKNQRGQVIVENASKQSFSSDILALLERKLKFEESYQLDKPIMIVEDFNCTTAVDRGISKRKIILICFGILLIGLIYASFIEFRPMIQKELSRT